MTPLHRIGGVAAVLALVAAAIVWRPAPGGPPLDGSGRFVALSLSRAATQSLPDDLLGITRVIGLVYDRDAQDFILIGLRGSGAPILTEDLIAAMRAKLVRGVYPLVSIDRAPDTDATNRQHVRFEGVDRSRFAAALLHADLRLKRLSLGIDHPSESYFARCANDVRAGSYVQRVTSLLWFYASDGALISRDGVFAIREIRIAVRAQTVAGEPDVQADEFAAHVSDRFDEIAAEYPEIAHLRTLYALVSVATAMEAYPNSAMRRWAENYELPRVDTPSEVELITRRERVAVGELVIDGGIQVAVRNIQLREGNVDVLRAIVLHARPSPDALIWPVPLDVWLEASPEVGDVPDDPTDTGTHVTRRIETVPDLLIYRGGILGNQRFGSSGPYSTESPSKPRGGVAADVQIGNEDFQRSRKGKRP